MALIALASYSTDISQAIPQGGIMKKLLALVIPISLCVLLVGCGGTTDNSDSSSQDKGSDNPAEQSITGIPSKLSFSYQADSTWYEDKVTDVTYLYYPEGDRTAQGAPFVLIDESYATKAIKDYDEQMKYLKDDLASSLGLKTSEIKEAPFEEYAGVISEYTDELGDKCVIYQFFTSPDTVAIVQFVASDTTSYDMYLEDYYKLVETLSL